jgi:hypothetical protein
LDRLQAHVSVLVLLGLGSVLVLLGLGSVLVLLDSGSGSGSVEQGQNQKNQYVFVGAVEVLRLK